MLAPWLGKRGFRRVLLNRYLEVRDRDSGTLMGRLLDISVDGMRLIHTEPFPLRRRFRFWVVVPGEDDRDPERIAVDAESLWSERDVNDDFFDTGFRLLDLDTATRGRLQTMERELGFDA